MSMPAVIPPFKIEVGPNGPHIAFSNDVLCHWSANRQKRWRAKEAGGQIFARIQGDAEWLIGKATGPKVTDVRSRFRFRAERSDEQRDIDNLFEDGWHYVGDWHTHPESRPRPSSDDLKSMNDIAEKSRHELPGLLLVIVGTADIPDGIWVSFHFPDGHWIPLHAEGP